MIRATLIAAFVLATAVVAQSDARPRLNGLVTVTGDLVRIGDLVENAGSAAGIAVFRAPDLGHTGSVSTHDVLAALRRHDIADVDTDGLSEVVVTRLSRAIAAKDVEARIARAIAGQRGFGPAENLKVALDRELRTLHVEADATGELAVTRLQVDPRSGRFDVSFELTGSTAARRMPLRFTGSVAETVETATLLRPLARGEVVRAADVVMERRPRAETVAGALEPDEVVGLEARRALRPGVALRAADLVRPEAVRRNEPVTIVHQVPGILLTVRGTALEGGSVGDHISVLNVQSNRTVQAQVAGPGRVVVTSTLPRALAAAVPAHPASSVSQ